MKRASILPAVLSAVFLATPAAAQISDDVVKLGVLTDMSSLYADINGPGAVVATQMAVEDFGGTVLGKKIEVIQADVQNKADVAVAIAGRWYDTEKVDVILGTAASSSSLATSGVAKEKKKVYLATDPASSDITGKACNVEHLIMTGGPVDVVIETGISERRSHVPQDAGAEHNPPVFSRPPRSLGQTGTDAAE